MNAHKTFSRNKRAFYPVLALLLPLSGLAGCGGPAATTTTTKTVTTTAPADSSMGPQQTTVERQTTVTH